MGWHPYAGPRRRFGLQTNPGRLWGARTDGSKAPARGRGEGQNSPHCHRLSAGFALGCYRRHREHGRCVDAARAQRGCLRSSMRRSSARIIVPTPQRHRPSSPISVISPATTRADDTPRTQIHPRASLSLEPISAPDGESFFCATDEQPWALSLSSQLMPGRASSPRSDAASRCIHLPAVTHLPRLARCPFLRTHPSSIASATSRLLGLSPSRGLDFVDAILAPAPPSLRATAPRDYFRCCARSNAESARRLLTSMMRNPLILHPGCAGPIFRQLSQSPSSDRPRGPATATPLPTETCTPHTTFSTRSGVGLPDANTSRFHAAFNSQRTTRMRCARRPSPRTSASSLLPQMKLVPLIVCGHRIYPSYDAFAL
jgi:hypothetical protein